MNLWEFLVVVIAIDVVYKLIKLKHGYVPKGHVRAGRQSVDEQNERLSHMEQRLGNLEALLVEQEKRRQEEEK